MKISEILLKYDTDKNKGKIRPELGHYYGEGYDEIFSIFDPESHLQILEIGIQKGGSLCAWKEFFPNSEIYGVDIVDCILPEYRNDTFNYYIEDVCSPKILTEFENNMFDIIIDDGSHLWKDIEYVLINFSGKLRKNGVLVIEDCQSPETWIENIKNLGLKLNMKVYDFRNKNKHYDDFLITLKNDNN